jgi:uncharacterized GH25 family protein
MAPHNIWIQCAPAARKGQEVECRLHYGHYLEVDGKAQAARARLWAAPPGRELEPLALAERDQSLAAVFTPAERGVYALLAEYDRGLWTVTRDRRYLPGPAAEHPGEGQSARTIQLGYFAKRLVFVDADGPWPGSFGMELEIVPLAPNGDELEMLVQHRGRPLPGAQVHAYCRGKPRTRFAVTGADGKADFGLRPGEWLLLVRHEEPAAVEGANFRVTNAVFGLTWQ